MSAVETISQRLLRAFPAENKQSLKAAAIIVNVERLLPASYIYPLPSPATSEERLDFIRFILKNETGIDYSGDEILMAHNVLMGNADTREQLNFDCGINKIQHYLNEYKRIHPKSAFANNFFLLLLLPHRRVCNFCKSQLNIIYQGRATVVYCSKSQPCSLYKADCYKCRRSYRISSIYSMDHKQTIVDYESQKSDYIHFSGSIVFSKEILISFSAQLVDNHVTFEGFAFATMKTINRLRSDNVDFITADTLARSLQSVWLNYELTNFIFMTTKSTEISFPFAMCEGRTKIKGKQSPRAIFIERNIDWIYHAFTTFWSNHEVLFGSCKCGNCSRVIIIDGHQKPRRLVCRYENVTSVFNADELGPVNKGCPYIPRRRKSDNREPNDNGNYYCDHHRAKCTEELSSATRMSDDELKMYLKHIADLDREESQCNVGRSDMEERFEAKKRSMGFIASFLNCGIIIGFSESVNHEGPRKITDHLLTMLKLGAKLPPLLVYDAACQLYKFWRYRFDTQFMKKTEFTEQLMNMIVVTDRFHNTVHTAKLCKTLFNPDSEENKTRFMGINTSLAEQTFSYLTKFKIALRSFSYPTSALFTILLFHLKNCDKLSQDPDQKGLIINSMIETMIRDQASSQNYCVFETITLKENVNEDDHSYDDTYVDISDHEDDNDVQK